MATVLSGRASLLLCREASYVKHECTMVLCKRWDEDRKDQAGATLMASPRQLTLALMNYCTNLKEARLDSKLLGLAKQELVQACPSKYRPNRQSDFEASSKAWPVFCPESSFALASHTLSRNKRPLT